MRRAGGPGPLGHRRHRDRAAGAGGNGARAGDELGDADVAAAVLRGDPGPVRLGRGIAEPERPGRRPRSLAGGARGAALAAGAGPQARPDPPRRRPRADPGCPRGTDPVGRGGAGGADGRLGGHPRRADRLRRPGSTGPGAARRERRARPAPARRADPGLGRDGRGAAARCGRPAARGDRCPGRAGGSGGRGDDGARRGVPGGAGARNPRVGRGVRTPGGGREVR